MCNEFLTWNPSLTFCLLSLEGQEDTSFKKIFKNTVLSESCIHLKIGSENLSLKTIFLKENTKNEIH